MRASAKRKLIERENFANFKSRAEINVGDLISNRVVSKIKLFIFEKKWSLEQNIYF